MSRSGYSDDLDNWDLIRWRGAVASAIKGRRGQALLKELEAALVALPNKKLCSYKFANAEKGEVCALGAVALKRRLDKGVSAKEALLEIEQKYPEDSYAETIHEEIDVAEALLKEITHINDEAWGKERYERVLAWVRENIKTEGKA